MKQLVYKANYANNIITYMFIYQATKYYFGKYISLSNDNAAMISLDTEAFKKAKQLLPEKTSNPYIEYRALISLTAKYLLKFNCCIFHSASFIYKNKAWLLCAPSGTGKTTQFLNWIESYPTEIIMISGDMPVLDLSSQNEINVYSSPWNGKERIGNKISAPLGGIIYLSQSKKNEIKELNVYEGATLLLNQYMCIPETENEIKTIFDQLDFIFGNYPILQYYNTGTKESTEILRREINKLI